MRNVLPTNLYEDQSIFYRFLKARDFNVDKAEKMLRKNLRWRKVFQIDTILADFKPKEVFLKHMMPSVIGQDKQGDMLVYCPIGKIESKDAFKSIKMNSLVRHVIWFSERTLAIQKEENEKTGRYCTQGFFILDLDKATFSNATAKLSAEILLHLLHMAQDNYPERLKCVYLINAPSYYTFIFSLLKAVMSNAMINKFNVFSQNGWREKLLEVIDADVLPAFLGGNRTDPDGDPMCKTFVVHGGKTAPTYCLSDEDRYFKDMDHVKMAIIPPIDRREIYVEVSDNGSEIQWRFLVKSKDIGFGLALQLSDGSTEEILPVEKYTTSDGTEEGSYKCQSKGKYFIIFDNSYSWMSSKEVEYCVTVISSEGTLH